MKLTESKLKEIIKEEFGNINEAQEIKDIGTLAQALAAHGITGPDFAAWESGEIGGRDITWLIIDTDHGRAKIRLEGPGGIKYGVY